MEDVPKHWPRFMSDRMLKEFFGLTDAALRRCRAVRSFPRRDALTDRTDSKAVELFFDERSGIARASYSATGRDVRSATLSSLKETF